MIININSSETEKLEWKEIKKILDYLSKRNEVYFRRTSLGDDWEIYAKPKNLTGEDLKNE